MRALDFFTPRQIRNRARQFQDAVIGTRRKIELTHRRPHQTLTPHRATCKMPDLPDMDICVKR